MNGMRSLRLTIFQQGRWIKPCQGESSLGQSFLGNERGVALVAALLVLLLLSVLAITFNDTTITEKFVVRSEAIFERVFFKAESGAMEGVQKLANESSPNELLPALVGAGNNNAGLLASVERSDREDNIAMTDTTGDSKFTVADIPAWDSSDVERTYRRVVLPDGGGGVGHEGSLKVTAPRDYYYSAFGYSDADNGSAMVKIGYVKHF
jgi:Tfp pilus assembly protein PilX